MKRSVLIFSFFISSFTAFGQLSLQASYNIWFPTGKYNSDLNLGFLGISAELKYAASDFVNVTAGVGFNLLGYETVRINRVERPAEGFSDNAALSIIPLTIGAEVFFNEDKLRPYLDLDFGVALAKTTGDNLPETNTAVNPFISPGLGIAYSLTDDLIFNGVVKQNVIIYNYDNRPNYLEAFTAVGVNLGITFKF